MKYFSCLLCLILFFSGCIFSYDDTRSLSLPNEYSLDCLANICSLTKKIPGTELKKEILVTVDSISWNNDNIYLHADKGYFKVDMKTDTVISYTSTSYTEFVSEVKRNNARLKRANNLK